MKSLLVFLTTLLIAVSANAQNPHRLSLEVKYNADLPPAYISVAGPEIKARWIWVTRFARVPGVELKNSLPIQAILVEPQFNGETPDTKVTLLRGHVRFDREDPVGTYQLSLNEPKIVTEVRTFGIEPITLTLIETAPPAPPSPAFENRTKSIEIVTVTSTNVPLPAYKLAVRNLSQKNVQALRVDVITDGRTRLQSFWQGELGKPLIAPGDAYERLLQVDVPQKTPTAYAPGTATESTIRIRGVVFDDLTFEGEEDAACRYEMFIVGRRLWLKRVLPLLDQELASKSLTPEDFKRKFESLTYELQADEKTGKSAVSSKCANPDLHVDISTQNLKLELLRDLDRIIKTRPAPPINFRAWLEGKRNDYRGWLARLSVPQ